MKIKYFIDKTTSFLFKRLSELIGIILICLSVLLFASLISYSPEDPNFIFPKDAEIKNLLDKFFARTKLVRFFPIKQIFILLFNFINKN